MNCRGRKAWVRCTEFIFFYRFAQLWWCQLVWISRTAQKARKTPLILLFSYVWTAVLITSTEPGQDFAQHCAAVAAAGLAATAWVGTICCKMSVSWDSASQEKLSQFVAVSQSSWGFISPKMPLKIKLWLSICKLVLGLLIPPDWLWRHSLPRDHEKVLKHCGLAALGLPLGKQLCTSPPQSGLEMVLCTDREKHTVGYLHTQSSF